VYLRGFLQRAFFLYRGMEPIGMTEQQRALAQSMAEAHTAMTPEDLLPGGRYSVEALSAQLSEIKARRQPEW
jgi:hypothetical protein